MPVSGTSILGVGKTAQTSALAGMQRVSKLEKDRKAFNDNVDQADMQQAVSHTISGAMIGTMIYPGIGTVIGAGIGYLASELY